MWNEISADFTDKYCLTNRKKELSWYTVYGNTSKANAFKKKEQGVQRSSIIW